MIVISDKKKRILQAKQQFVVDQTLHLIEATGIHQLTMDDMAQKSGYTKRTLYAFFTSKDEILLWAFNDDLSARWKYQQQELAKGKTGLEKLEIWSMSLYDHCQKNKHALELQKYMDYNFVDLEKINSEIANRFKAINQELAEGLRAIMKDGMADQTISNNLDPDMTISQFLYAFRAILNRAFTDGYTFAQFDANQYIRHFLELFMKSIKV